ncbi:MAG: HEAT repeat domain-containing protein [Planctomycetota bacterium]|jgi:hypothetical protein
MRAFSLLILIALPARADPTDLIELLGSEEAAVRSVAQRTLARLGPAAYPALLQARTHDDPEIRREATALLRRTARAFKAPKRTKTRFIVRKGSLQGAAAALRKTYGVPVRVEGTSPSPICVDEKLTFWDAVLKVCAAGKVGLGPGYDAVVLGARHPQPRFAYADGPLLVFAKATRDGAKVRVELAAHLLPGQRIVAATPVRLVPGGW